MLKKRDHLSYSAFKAFRNCEAAAAAGWKKDSKAFLEGRFFEAALTGKMGEFLSENGECLKRDGELKAEFVKAESAANRLLEQETIFDIIQRCEKQKEVKGEIAGIPFVGYIDLYDPETGDCYDIKYIRSFDPIWNSKDRIRESWHKYYGYGLQAAIYDELLGGGTRQHIIAATKETVPDIAFMCYTELALQISMTEILRDAPHYWAIAQGEKEPERCEQCEYCKLTRKLTLPQLITGDE